MKSLDSLKNDMKVMGDLADVTNMLEQVAARDIARMRGDILSKRSYFAQVWRVYRALKDLTPPAPQVTHKHLVVAVGLDWGMPGDLLTKMLNRATELQRYHEADIVLAGKKLHQRYQARDGHTIHYFSVPKGASLKDIQPIYKVVAGYAKVTFVYPQFETLSIQHIVTASFDLDEGADSDTAGASALDAVKSERFVVYPDPQAVANYLNEAVVGITVHHYFAEALLAYSASQMVAMRNGNSNAKDAGRDIREKYHRTRRAMIDAKIRELSSGRNQKARR